MPIVLPIAQTYITTGIQENVSKISICDETNLPLAILYVESVYSPDYEKECLEVYGTNDDNHPFVKEVMARKQRKEVYVGGRIEMIQLPVHFDFEDIRATPAQVKEQIENMGWNTVVAFQTRNPMHSHMELTLRSLEKAREDTGDDFEQSGILLHPVVGVTQACDINYHTRVRCYKKIMEHYPDQTVTLALLPLSMRMAGPRRHSGTQS